MQQFSPKVYVFGNGNLSLSEFIRLYLPPMEAVLAEAEFILCDFRGVDTLAMEFLKTQSAKVSVLHVGERPRYLPDKYRTKVGAWNVTGGHADDAARDAAAIEACTHFIAWDFNSNEKRQSGTLRNIEACLQLGKTRLGAI